MAFENTNTFPKEQHLCGKTAIERLYQEGNAFLSYPLRIVFREVSGEAVPVRCMVSVSKKKFKRAVCRNYIKRQLRETYRTNKSELFSALSFQDRQLHVAITYIGEKKEPAAFIEKKMKAALIKLLEQLK